MEKTFVLESVIYLSLSPFIKKIKIVPPGVHGVKFVAWDLGPLGRVRARSRDGVLACRFTVHLPPKSTVSLSIHFGSCRASSQITPPLGV